ncbi:DgyrCDS14497 [Dimorphilus gyrociliatus]|uniref:DgyrCDS14497 n=1 Tax=Dimorphilus gyrociliatus TaxID=2664684 RepID=A0A7I8WE04_9ANNE|nr:DgyrCDS14497 [Dimorphilus gyrociliatus]
MMNIIQIITLFILFHIQIRSTISNLARNKPAFQSSTAVSLFGTAFVPEYANDDHIEISNTAASILHILKIYFSDYLLNNLEITVHDSIDGPLKLCQTVSLAVKQPTTTDFSQYNCYNCPENLNGYLVRISHQTSNISLTICDVYIEGKFFDEKVEHLLQSEHLELRYGVNDNNDVDNGGKNAIDKNYTTIFHSKTLPYSYSTPYLLIDTKDIIPRDKFEDIYVAVSLIPETMFHQNLKFCIRNYRNEDILQYQLAGILCNETHTGRYINILKYNFTNNENAFKLNEIFIYTAQRKDFNLAEFNSKSNIESMTLNGVSKIVQYMNDDVYHPSNGPGLQLLRQAERLEIAMETSTLNSICLTVYHAHQLTNDILIEVENFVTKTLVSTSTNGNFKYVHTVCCSWLCIFEVGRKAFYLFGLGVALWPEKRMEQSTSEVKDLPPPYKSINEQQPREHIFSNAYDSIIPNSQPDSHIVGISLFQPTSNAPATQLYVQHPTSLVKSIASRRARDFGYLEEARMKAQVAKYLAIAAIIVGIALGTIGLFVRVIMTVIKHR